VDTQASGPQHFRLFALLANPVRFCTGGDPLLSHFQDALPAERLGEHGIELGLGNFMDLLHRSYLFEKPEGNRRNITIAFPLAAAGM
jgi:hypothetical protein